MDFEEPRAKRPRLVLVLNSNGATNVTDESIHNKFRASEVPSIKYEPTSNQTLHPVAKVETTAKPPSKVHVLDSYGTTNVTDESILNNFMASEVAFVKYEPSSQSLSCVTNVETGTKRPRALDGYEAVNENGQSQHWGGYQASRPSENEPVVEPLPAVLKDEKMQVVNQSVHSASFINDSIVVLTPPRKIYPVVTIDDESPRSSKPATTVQVVQKNTTSTQVTTQVPSNKASDDSHRQSHKTQPVRDGRALSSHASRPRPPACPVRRRRNFQPQGPTILRMYMLDARADSNNPGIIWLFGKVWSPELYAHVSCCISVANIERTLFVLPRKYKYNRYHNELKKVSFSELLAEMKWILAQHRIYPNRHRFVEKRYALGTLDSSFPSRTHYLEIVYRVAASQISLPGKMAGDNFKHVFGTQNDLLESFLLERHIKGPCWLDILCTEEQAPSRSWYQREAFCQSPSGVNVFEGYFPAPPLTMLAVGVLKDQCSEVFGVTFLQDDSFYMSQYASEPLFQKKFCALSGDVAHPWSRDELNAGGTKTVWCADECNLLSYVVGTIQEINPDLIVCYDADKSWQYLARRCTELKIECSRLSGYLPAGWSRPSAELVHSQLVCDLKTAPKLLFQLQNVSLEALCQEILHTSATDRRHMSTDEIRRLRETTAGAAELVSMITQDTQLVLRLVRVMGIVPLALELAHIAGSRLADTLSDGCREQCNYALLQEFAKHGYIVPDRNRYPGVEVSKRRDTPPNLYASPNMGLHERFFLEIDFTSHATNIMLEKNICLSNVSVSKDGKVADPRPGLERGIVPRVLDKIVTRLDEVKEAMDHPGLSPEQRLRNDFHINALLLLAEGIGASLMYRGLRFFSPHFSEWLQQQNRVHFSKRMWAVRKLMCLPIAGRSGDINSLLIDTQCTDYDQATVCGIRIVTTWAKEVGLGWVHVKVLNRIVLMLNKKYAGVAVTMMPNKVLREMYTSNQLCMPIGNEPCSSPLIMETLRFINDQLLHQQDPEQLKKLVFERLSEVRNNLMAGAIPPKLLVGFKRFTKTNPGSIKALSPENVASRMNLIKPNTYCVGDGIPFIVCKDSSNGSTTFYHPSELYEKPHRIPDPHYYLDLLRQYYRLYKSAGITNAQIKTSLAASSSVETEPTKQSTQINVLGQQPVENGTATLDEPIG